VVSYYVRAVSGEILMASLHFGFLSRYAVFMLGTTSNMGRVA